MGLLYQFLETQAQSLIDQGIRVEAIGERELLPRLVRDLLNDLETRSAGGRTMLLTLALSYDGRRDLLKATKALVDLARKGNLLPADVHEELLMSHLSTGKYQEVDLLIRTSGERRLSGFLPLEACYAELIFLDKMWPEFTSDDLDEALTEYALRQRRFGLTEAQSYITPELFFSPT
jgi:undecaprenyl diphosphate synthase